MFETCEIKPQHQEEHCCFQNSIWVGNQNGSSTKSVKHLFRSCIDAPCYSFFCPKTCLNSLFFPVLLLPFYPDLLMWFVNDEETHLVFLPPGVQKMGRGHHHRCTKGWWQKEMGYKRQGREYLKKLKPHDSFGSREYMQVMAGLIHGGAACMGCRGQETGVVWFPLLGNQAIWRKR